MGMLEEGYRYCARCKYKDVDVHVPPCRECFKTPDHESWEPVEREADPKETEKKDPEEAERGMTEKRDCSTCRWKFRTDALEPCKSCDGYEFDKWEPEPEDSEAFVDQMLADMDAQGTIQEIVKRQREALAEIVGSNIADSLIPNGGSLGPVGDFEKELEALMEKSRNKPVYQQEIEKLIDAQVKKGLDKYGVTLEDNVTLTQEQRVEHLEEELIDGLMYCEHLKAVLRGEGITADDYQRAALRTAQVDSLPNGELLLNGVMGLCGEAGECIDLVKKARFQGHELDMDKLRDELGDVAWYLAVASFAAGFNLSEVFERNVEKLKARYPDGFDKARSMNRE